MLINESVSYQIGAVIMTDLSIVAATTKVAILEIAKQSAALGTGLQNAAPGDKAGVPNNSVQYLLAISEALTKIALQCDLLYKHTHDLPKNET